MISIDRLKEIALDDIENNPEKHLEEYTELFQQLDRKTQECEELKNNFNIEHAELLNARSEIEKFKRQVESDKGLITNAGKQNYQLIQEYDRLKTENEEYQLFIEKLCEYAGLECDSEEQAIRTLSDLASQMNKARWIIDRYKQTLTEIKKIAEKIDDSDGCAYGDYYYNNCSSLEQETVCTYKVKKLILQKISECEVK